MGFEVTILGCGSATPSLKHLPSCQVVEHNGHYFMIDCGECAQLSLRRSSVRFSRINHIFISHLHGDHVLGLPGFLSSLSLQDFTGEVHVYMFAEGIEVIKSVLGAFAHQPTYHLVFHPLEMARKVVYEDKGLTVETVPLAHRVPAVGFLLREKPKPRHLRGDMLEYYQVPVWQRPLLKTGADFVTADGRTIENSRLTSDPEPPMSYAYISDTMPSPSVVEAIRGVDLLYHEATYGDDKADSARQRGHSTARQAAQVARQAGVKRLVIGHFSKAYNTNEGVLLEQACEEFPDTILAHEGMKIKA